MEFRRLLVRVAILLAFLTLTNGMCPICPDKVHPQEAFCAADFVIKATVDDLTNFGDDPLTTDIDPQDKYKVFVEKVYKGNVTTDCYTYVWTLRGSLPCGVELTLEKTFLISGVIEEGVLIMDACGLHEPWDDVTSHMKIGVNKRYEKNCQCEIGDDRCKVDPALDKSCYCKYATCVQFAQAGCAPECKWKQSQSFSTCITNSIP
ncbi:metalloproteinase inhibitor 3-like [Mizuhopecten yessoensis]|uniref:Metalloproteinase inhibitor 3 n=1 Tax=Mizuhopecten yessoensis TaxID=6573 RepID=A0A210Q0Q0_MIZYE|nr:metalloproteinase inhibitor 3-like [Mizuhopecten yessoensis]OWF42323.1 Metalloproteinase inhibitor 3 [Mizuhopecten yessoensis]